MDDDATGYEDVLRFWLEDCGPQDWYVGGEALDTTIRDRFCAAWEAARAGRLSRCTPTWRGAALSRAGAVGALSRSGRQGAAAPRTSPQ